MARLIAICIMNMGAPSPSAGSGRQTALAAATTA
jgi:hypothetical protein